MYSYPLAKLSNSRVLNQTLPLKKLLSSKTTSRTKRITYMWLGCLVAIVVPLGYIYGFRAEPAWRSILPVTGALAVDAPVVFVPTDEPAAANEPTVTPTSWPVVDPVVVPRNIIIMVGDGMGQAHIDAASMYKYGEAGAMAFEYAPFQAEMTVYSADAPITDSAASITAMATGHKVNNRVISLQIPGDGAELETSLEYFRDRCKRTGLVTSSSMTHATPAGFGAHEAFRFDYPKIAADYFTQTRPNLLFGGTESGITPQAAEDAGYQVVSSRDELENLSIPDDPFENLFISGQFGSGHLDYEFEYAVDYSDLYDTQPHLSEMTEAALDLLEDSPDGFFLMIEGARIDHAGHANLIKHNVFETIEFENAFIKVIQWMTDRDDTLLLVLADHETGGLTIQQNKGQYKFPDVSWESASHSARNVPAFAWGPNAQMVNGTIDNTDIYSITLAGNQEQASCGATLAPTPVPTEAPTEVPTEAPTPVPTEAPTLVPTETSTPEPTKVPTKVLTVTPVPTEAATEVPTAEPTAVAEPMVTPILLPVDTPVPTPTGTPTGTPMPESTTTSAPTGTPLPTDTPVPTEEEPADTPVQTPTRVPSTTTVPDVVTHAIDVAIQLTDGNANVVWEFSADGKTQWFHVYRSASSEVETAQVVTARPIPAPVTGTNKYQFKDEFADGAESEADTCFYWLEQIFEDGKTVWHGPQELSLTQEPIQFFMPLIEGE